VVVVRRACWEWIAQVFASATLTPPVRLSRQSNPAHGAVWLMAAPLETRPLDRLPALDGPASRGRSTFHLMAVARCMLQNTLLDSWRLIAWLRRNRTGAPQFPRCKFIDKMDTSLLLGVLLNPDSLAFACTPTSTNALG
jgi:hypothetical protein